MWQRHISLLIGCNFISERGRVGKKLTGDSRHKTSHHHRHLVEHNIPENFFPPPKCIHNGSQTTEIPFCFSRCEAGEEDYKEFSPSAIDFPDDL